jgi:hypothetical protein
MRWLAILVFLISMPAIGFEFDPPGLKGNKPNPNLTFPIPCGSQNFASYGSHQGDKAMVIEETTSKTCNSIQKYNLTVAWEAIENKLAELFQLRVNVEYIEQTRNHITRYGSFNYRKYKWTDNFVGLKIDDSCFVFLSQKRGHSIYGFYCSDKFFTYKQMESTLDHLKYGNLVAQRGNDEIINRLKKLNELEDAGLISKGEAAKKRKEILENL